MTNLRLRLFVLVLALTPTARCDEPKPATGEYPFTVTVRGEGIPMILIPGLSCSGAVWNATVKHFEKKFECHVLTLAGFAGVPPQKGPFLVPVREGIVRYIREKKLDRPVVIGHSIGGFLTYDLGIEASEVVGPLIAVDGLPFLPALSNDKATESDMKTVAAGVAKRVAEIKREDYLRQQEATLALWIDDKAKRALPIKWGGRFRSGDRWQSGSGDDGPRSPPKCGEDQSTRARRRGTCRVRSCNEGSGPQAL